MADHTITLSVDEEGALAEQVARAQDDTLTVDGQLATIVHGALAQAVTAYITEQTQLAAAVMGSIDPVSRAEFFAALSQLTLEDRVDAMTTALTNQAARLTTTPRPTPITISPSPLQ